jgi:hypothetical protein
MYFAETLLASRLIIKPTKSETTLSGKHISVFIASQLQMVIPRATLAVTESRVPYTTRNEQDQELLFI